MGHEDGEGAPWPKGPEIRVGPSVGELDVNVAEVVGEHDVRHLLGEASCAGLFTGFGDGFYTGEAVPGAVTSM